MLPVSDLAFSLSEYGYTDTAEDVNLLRNNGLSGVVEWTLTRDGEAFPLSGGFTLALSEVGEYVLTAKLTDAAGTQYTAAQKIIILPAEQTAEVELPEELLALCSELGISKDKVKIVLRATEEDTPCRKEEES